MTLFTVGIAGNPNVGKTTILNKIAGKNLKVGNWAGVTVEKSEVYLNHSNRNLHIIDLPGIYGLKATTDAEKIAVNFLKGDEIDIIVNVIDLSNFKRNMLLTIELLELGKPVVLALNMADESKKSGVRVDISEIESLLGARACLTVGKKGEGVDTLLKHIIESCDGAGVSTGRNGGGAGFKLPLGDSEEAEEERWKIADSVEKKTTNFSDRKTSSTTHRLDNVLLHPYLGIVIYILLFYLMFKISFDFSAPYMSWIDGFMNNFLSAGFTSLAVKIGLPVLLIKFVTEAVIGGVGFVVTFVPLIAILYFFITFFEMSGYLPRIVFLMDRFMHRIGLHGNMMTPLLLSFGCNVPAIMATKNLENKTDKILVGMMIPFMSCPARLVVFAYFSFIFFDHPALVIVSLYLIGIVVALLMALVLRRSYLKGKKTNFVLEMPPYRLPSYRTVVSIVWAHVKSFLYRAGTVIFVISMIVWGLLNLPPGIKGPDESIAASIGKAITPIFRPIGLDDWRATTSLIPAFMAREVVLSSMAVIYKTSESEAAPKSGNESLPELVKDQVTGLLGSVKDSFVSVATLGFSSLKVDESKDSYGLKTSIKKAFTPASAYSFMILLLLYNSCVATVAIMIRELGKKYSLIFLGGSFVIAWVLAFVVFNVWKLM
ncbi:MAG: ferrous iron transport protein B [Thermodesulfobacteriota bacterium]